MGGMRDPVPSSRGSGNAGIGPDDDGRRNGRGPGPRTAGEGGLTVGCVWQSTYPPDGRFADARVHQRFAPRHRKPPRWVRMARAATPAVGRLRTRLFPPEMHEDPAEVLLVLLDPAVQLLDFFLIKE